MVEILQNKNSATRFQILVEIATSGPGIQQKNIALKLGLTPQAISEYIRQLVADELIISSGRAHYRVSAKGVNWMLKILRELRDYASVVEQAVTNITVCAAIADADINKGQAVGLRMKDGLLFATAQTGSGARGIAVSSVKKGEDVDVASIQGLVELTRGRITILQVPGIQKGGSRQVDLQRLKAHARKQPVGAIGIEALVSLRRTGIEPPYLYGVTEAAIEAARCGLPFTVVCTEDAIPGLIKRLQQEEELSYELIDLRLKKR
jgi:putative transcriptional regulator